MVLENPSNYLGEFGNRGSNEQYFHDKSFIVNGVVNKADGNLLRGFFVSEVANSGIIIGPYPLYEIDVNQISAHGVTAVINLQTPIEIKQRGADVNEINSWYRQKGINTIINHPIDDTNENSLYQGLLEGSARLNQLMATGKNKVYVHCTSSVTRAPTLLNLYLCLYVKAVDWQSPMQVKSLIQYYHKPAYPNMKMVNQIINDNQSIQNAEF